MTRALEEQAIDYALTLTSGAELVAPFATATDRLSVVVPLGTDLAALAQTTRLKSVEDGANIAFLLPRSRTPLMLRQRLDDAWVASDVQLYLDLFSLPARGKEQAKHLRAARLKF